MNKSNLVLNSDYKFYQYSYQLNLENLILKNFICLKIIIKQFKLIEERKKLNEGKSCFINMKIAQQENFLEIEKLIIKKLIITKRNLKTFEANIINKYYKLIINKNNNYKFKICHCLKDDKKFPQY